MAVSDSTPSDATLASDKAIRPFLAPTFDPADFLNATLPSWIPATSRQQPSSTSANGSFTTTTLTELNAEAQTLLSQLNAQLTRLSSMLTKFTDDILRAGGRLAYEVDVLRGDTGALADVLTDGLRADIAVFVPPEQLHRRDRNTSVSSVKSPTTPTAPKVAPADPQVRQLRTLALVRDRLESVIQVFGQAIEWPVAPSEVSLKSSFISVSGPDEGVDDVSAREARAREHAEATREELGSLLVSGGSPEEGLKAALEKIEQLKSLAEVWKGTSEEKARSRFIDGLFKLVEDRSKAAPNARAMGYRVRADSQPRNPSSIKR